jgi:hypothetical protein
VNANQPPRRQDSQEFKSGEARKRAWKANALGTAWRSWRLGGWLYQ